MCKWAKHGSASRVGALYKTLLFLFILPVYRAALFNRTIDSNLGDPVTGFMPIYQPHSPWGDQTCSTASCVIQPDRTLAFDGTWNAATYLPSLENVNVTLRFTGVAIWVFFILSNANSHGTDVTTNTQLNITLNGEYLANYSHYPHMNTQDLTYNALIFAKIGLTNTSHELVIATNDYPNQTYINFDWAIYTVDNGAPESQSISTATAFLSTTDPSSVATTSPPTPATLSQSSPSKTGIIVGCSLGGLAVIVVVLVFLVRRLHRAPPLQYGKAEGILDIDVPRRLQPFYEREIPVPDHEPTQRKAARLREERQRELNERIQSAQHELDNLRSLRNARSAGEIGDPSAAGLSRPSPELALLRNEMQQLRNRMDYLQAQRESDWALGLSIPPAYIQQSNNVQRV